MNKKTKNILLAVTLVVVVCLTITTISLTTRMNPSPLQTQPTTTTNTATTALNQTISSNESNLPGYKYAQQIASVDGKTLTRLGVNWTEHLSFMGRNASGSKCLNALGSSYCEGYNYTLVTIFYEGNFTSDDAVVYYTLTHYEFQVSHGYSSNSSSSYGLRIHFGTIHPSSCDLTSPRSNTNCNEMLLINLDSQTSPPFHKSIPVPPTGADWVKWGYYASLDDYKFENTKFYFPDLLNAHLTFILETFQGYSWCPVQGVDNVTRLLCRFNPDYNYQEVVSRDVSGIPNTGTFTWQNITLSYSLSANGLLKVTEESGPTCDVTKPRSANNCQQVVLLGFDVPNYPGRHAPFDAAYVLPHNQTETFSLYAPSSSIQQHLYVIIGTYVGDYKGTLLPSYNSDMSPT